MRAPIPEGEVVVVVGLTSEQSRGYNGRAGVVLPTGPEPSQAEAGMREEPRIAVKLVHRRQGEPAEGKRLLVKRCNLKRPINQPADRSWLITLNTWISHPALRVAKEFLLEKLQGEEGLCLHIASFVAPRETMVLTSGFAMGLVVPDWSYLRQVNVNTPAKPRAAADAGAVDPAESRVELQWTPLHRSRLRDEVAPDRRPCVWNAESVKDGMVRIDCACVAVDPGLYLVAGGCPDHPKRSGLNFFSSAYLYDSLTNSAQPLPDMLCHRHGCSGARIGRQVYVFGGEYIHDHILAEDEGLGPAMPCEVFDLDLHVWRPLNAPTRRLQKPSQICENAFIPMGALGGRLVVVLQGNRPHVYNPQFPEEGWQECPGGEGDGCPVFAGHSAQACVVWRDHLVIAAGRGNDGTADVWALRLGAPSGDAQQWALCHWLRLGAHGTSGRVGCGLAVVQDRLYISGGVDEATSHFDPSIARWTGDSQTLVEAQVQSGGSAGRDLNLPWEVMRDMEMPTAMHAHHTLAIPLMHTRS